MRISQLSRATEVPVATIKYYLREGLLFPGTATAPNQAEYDSRHIHRLRLIRILREVGKLGIARIRDIVRAVDDESLPMHRMLGVAHHALGPAPAEGPAAEGLGRALRDVDWFIDELGWKVSADAPARRALAEALVALRELGWKEGAEAFEPYAKAAEAVASNELSRRPPEASRAETVEWLVVGTIVFETVLTSLRRLAEEHHSALQLQEPGRPVVGRR